MSDHPNGKPGPGEKRYGKPAEPSRGKSSGFSDRKYGKAAAPAERKYGKPAPGSHAHPSGTNDAPAERKYGKPAPGSHARPSGTNDAPAERKYGKPAPGGYARPSGTNDAPAERKYGKPAPRDTAGPSDGMPGFPARDLPRTLSGENRAAKPVPPGDRKYSRPANPSERRFSRATPADRKYGKPAPRPSRPAFNDPRANPRFLALNVLLDVTKADAYASLALSKRLRESSLTPRDRDLATELAYGVLERRIALDYILDARLTQNDVEPVVRDILRLGAYQMLYLDRIPDSAAVDESVKLCAFVDREPFTGLVNGVLRGIAREKDALSWPDREKEPMLALSVRHSLPLWIVERLYDAYGPEETEAIAAYRGEDRGIIVRPNPDKQPSDGFEAMMTRKHWDFVPGKLPGLYRVSGAGDVGLDKEYLQGYYSVQGEGSVLAAMAVAPSRGMSVLDACAAPGGKTAYLAQMMGGTGRVYAWDVHEHRVELIRSMTKRLFLDSVRPAVRDATLIKEDLIGALDAVLLDVPCSGLGVMLSKPDVKYRASAEAVESLVGVQKSLLDTCCQYVKPGGTLVYSTCTILPEENARQIDGFLATHPEFTLNGEGLSAAMPDFLKERAALGRVQLLPYKDGMEGFFIARMVRARP